MMAPCKNCSDRRLHCHSSCEKYLEFRKDIDIANSKKKDDRSRYSETIERMNRHSRRKRR